MCDSIFVIGGGGHAKVIISILKKLRNYSVIGYSDIASKGIILDINYLGDDTYIFQDFKINGVQKASIGVGLINNFQSRISLINSYIQNDFLFPSIITPDSIVNEQVFIDSGTCVMDGVVINSGSAIGKYSILNTKCSIDHDCQIGDNVHVAPGSTICGDVSIGSNVMVGAGATIVQGLKICSDVIIGAGSVVTKDISESGTYVGIPAKRIK